MADKLVLLTKPGNAGGVKEPDFWRVTGRDQESGDWLCLSTPLNDSAVTEGTLLIREDMDALGVTTEAKQSVVCWPVKPVGEPDAGNPHVRFDERECGNGAW